MEDLKICDKLIPIPRDQWPKLRELFLQDWPKHQIAFHTIQNYINWVQIDPKMKALEVLGLNDSWIEDGTYIVVDRYHMFMYTLGDPEHSLKRALRLIDWDYSYFICCVDESFHEVLTETLKSLSVEVLFDVLNYVYGMTKEECLKLDVTGPEGFHLRKLEMEDAIIANQVYPHRFEGSKYFFKRLAAWNPSVGLFNESGGLMAWCFSWPTGGIGPLAVAEKNYRKGYGSIVLKAIAKEVAKVDRNCYGTVAYTNEASNSMFKKAGFKLIGRQFYLQTSAKKLVEYSVEQI